MFDPAEEIIICGDVQIDKPTFQNRCGKAGVGLILWRLSAGPQSFSQLSKGLSGITPKVLTERLAALTDKALVERSQGKGFPRTTNYELTERGKELAAQLRHFYHWAAANPLSADER